MSDAKPLPLDVLPTFAAVADAGSMRAAGEVLHLTHSAISQQIRLLEERLGFAVFTRQGRGLVLTPAGQRLLDSTRSALAQLAGARQDAARLAQDDAQALRVAILPSFAQRWMMPRMARWRAAHPQLRLELTASMHMADLRQEGLHAAIRHGSGQWRGLRAEPLIQSPRVVLGSPAAAARLAAQGPAAIAQEPLLGNTTLWRQWFDRAGVTPAPAVHPVAAFNDAALLLQAVEADVGLGLVRDLLAADALVEGRLVQLAPQTLPESHDTYGHDPTVYWLAWREDLSDWPPLQALRDWLHSELARSRAQLAAQRTNGPHKGAP